MCFKDFHKPNFNIALQRFAKRTTMWYKLQDRIFFAKSTKVQCRSTSLQGVAKVQLIARQSKLPSKRHRCCRDSCRHAAPAAELLTLDAQREGKKGRSGNARNCYLSCFRLRWYAKSALHSAAWSAWPRSCRDSCHTKFHLSLEISQQCVGFLALNLW